MGNKDNKLGFRIWISFILIGLVGQFAWTIENMYFNVFLYNTISTNPTYIANMVSASAIVATVTTLIMGALSDKVAKRKIFICGGYILWGFSTLAFSFISVDNIAAWFPAVNAVAMSAGIVVVLDCVMTFFGSTANDGAFNAYITDVTNKKNRGRAESVLATLPLLSMIIIFGGFDFITQQGKWSLFFAIFGISVIVTGIVSIFLIKDSKPEKKNDSYFKNIIYGFRPKVIRNNAKLYVAFIGLLIYSIAVQVFFPYMIIYMQNYLGIDAYAIVLGIVLIIASAVSVISGKFMDKSGRMNFALPAVAVMFAGLLGMFFVRHAVSVTVAGIVMMSGYMLVVAVLSATIRDYTPADKAGHFQGIRMIFAVLLPMVTGPYIGAAIINGSSKSTYIELGQVKNVPTPGIFLGAAIVLLLMIIPIVILKKGEKDENKVV